jgi:hypothetical protein
MAVDITALYCCLDDFCKVFADWEAHQLIPSPTRRQRSGKLSRSEMLFIMVLFHLSAYKNFKTFSLHGIGHQDRACFGHLPHDDRFVSLMPRLFVPLMVLLHSLSREMFTKLWQRGLHLITGIRRNMRNHLMLLGDTIMLRKRFVIETVLKILKSDMGLEHSRHRSPVNAMVHVPSCLVAYAYRPGKPSISLTRQKIKAYP